MINLSLKAVVGFDVGATKTRGVIINLEKGVVRRVEGGSASLSAETMEEAAKNYEEVINKLFEGFKKLKLVSAGVATASYVSKAEDLLKSFYGGPLRKYISLDKVHIFLDVLSAYISVFLFNPGVIYIAGTGSIAFGIKNEKHVIVGGAGYLIGDEGSAFHVGQMGFNRALRALDGRGERTILVKRILEYLSVGDPEEALIAIYTSKNPKELIAGFAPYVVEEARRGDKVSMDILKTAVDEIALAIYTALKRLGDLELPIGIVGGFWEGAKDVIAPLLKAKLNELLNRDIKFEEQKIHPECAAALEALRRENLLSEEIINLVMRTCKR